MLYELIGFVSLLIIPTGFFSQLKVDPKAKTLVPSPPITTPTTLRPPLSECGSSLPLSRIAEACFRRERSEVRFSRTTCLIAALGY
ncbi:hypothetical protein [Rubritalea tangerina]|uniref:hypothetical protein n=1 Tax=Rubritalea tangerina TaxID=430798 RepID=UPI0036132626